VFRAHGILLQKTFGDNLQSSYDGISTTELGLHIVGIILYPRHVARGVDMGGGTGSPIQIANVEIWIVPGISKQARADAQAAIDALARKCKCSSPSLAMENGLVTVMAGDWRGKRWVMKAGDIANGQYCVQLVFASSPRLFPGGCGSIHPRNPSHYLPPNIGAVAQLASRYFPAAVFGPIVSTARRVQITFTNGLTETVPAIAPPARLNAGIRFYAVQRPCHATFTMIRGLNGLGQVVASWMRPPNPLAIKQFAREIC
jgi:hypothetical protein